MAMFYNVISHYKNPRIDHRTHQKNKTHIPISSNIHVRPLLTAKQNRSTEGCSKLKRSIDITSSGKNGLNIKNKCKSQMGQDQVSGGVSVLCWLAAPVAMVYGNLQNMARRKQNTASNKGGCNTNGSIIWFWQSVKRCTWLSFWKIFLIWNAHDSDKSPTIIYR